MFLGGLDMCPQHSAACFNIETLVLKHLRPFPQVDQTNVFLESKRRSRDPVKLSQASKDRLHLEWVSGQDCPIIHVRHRLTERKEVSVPLMEKDVHNQHKTREAITLWHAGHTVQRSRKTATQLKSDDPSQTRRQPMQQELSLAHQAMLQPQR